MNISGYDDWKLDNPFHGERTYKGEAEAWVGMWMHNPGIDESDEVMVKLKSCGFYNIKIVEVGDGDPDFVDFRVTFNWEETFDCSGDDLEDEVRVYIILELESAGLYPTSIDEVYIY